MTKLDRLRLDYERANMEMMRPCGVLSKSERDADRIAVRKAWEAMQREEERLNREWEAKQKKGNQ